MILTGSVTHNNDAKFGVKCWQRCLNGDGSYTTKHFLLLSVHPVTWSTVDVMPDNDKLLILESIECNECNALMRPPDKASYRRRPASDAIATCTQTARGFSSDCCRLSCPLNHALFHRFTCMLSAVYSSIYTRGGGTLSTVDIVVRWRKVTCDMHRHG